MESGERWFEQVGTVGWRVIFWKHVSWVERRKGLEEGFGEA